MVRGTERRPSSGPSFELVESKLRPPWARPGIVSRSGLVGGMLGAGAARVVRIVAPPGYGKTTLLAQWARRAGRRTGWVTLDRGDNDPSVLLTYLAVALDRIEPIEPGVFRALGSPDASLAGTVVPRLADAVRSMTEPIALALDQVEVLDNPHCLEAVAEVAAYLPHGSQLAMASRIRPPLPGTGPEPAELGVAQLAMDRQEARALLEAAGVRLAGAEVTDLHRRTEGWPVGLYLAALALKGGGRQATAGVAFSGDDRFVADYLRSEVLARVPPAQVRFLTRTAVLDRLCGSLCNAVVGTRGSGPLLESLAASNLLVVPLDREHRWYRYHNLFRDLLRAELQRREPDLVPQLHSRAAAWCEAHGQSETAVEHAQAAGDADRVAHLVTSLAQPAYAAGRVRTARRWLAWFEDQGLIERYPRVAVEGAWLQALVGNPAESERWAAAAEHALARRGLPDRERVEAGMALLRAFMCRDGVARMRADAEFAWRRLEPGSPWRATALGLQGISFMLDGDPERADPILARAVEAALRAGAMPAAAAALGQRCMVAMDGDRWPAAEDFAEHALEVVRAARLDDYAMTSFIHAVVARTAAHRGDLDRARDHLALAARLRPQLNHAMPHRGVQTLLQLTRAHLTLGDLSGARETLEAAQEMLRRRPDLGVLPAEAGELRAELEAVHDGAGNGWSLTTAELRLIPLLSTHLTFREIGEHLRISQHTAKSQARSVYRKLGASSRGQAVRRAQEIGLGA